MGGAALFLGGLLVLAGALKLASPASFRHAVYRLLPEHWRRRRLLAFVSAPLAGTTECIVGASLLGAPWLDHLYFVLSAALSAMLYVAFAGVVAYAMRQGASCGCFASFSDGPAGPAELGRAGLLAAIAMAVAVGSANSSGPISWRWPIAAWALACAAVTVMWVVLSDRVSGRRDGVRPSLARPSAIALQAAGRVTTDLGDTPLPIERSLSPAETRAVVATTLASPSYRALADWLGPRAGAFDWAGAVAEASTLRDTTGEGLTVIELVPRTPEPTRLSVLVGLDGVPAGDVLVFGVVDGMSVVASDGTVRPGGEPVSALGTRGRRRTDR
jgi:hypothetical protein